MGSETPTFENIKKYKVDAKGRLGDVRGGGKEGIDYVRDNEGRKKERGGP